MSKKRSRAHKIKQASVRTGEYQDRSASKVVEIQEIKPSRATRGTQPALVSQSSTVNAQSSKHLPDLIGYDQKLILRDLLKSLLLSLLLIAVLMGIFLYTKSN
ncbi:MAG TPA: hypothetical protein PKX78_03695 [Candidatus Woesebacteria bacterium]|nr:hypothetical protein [Candidatus Woesebacteria bacterium]